MRKQILVLLGIGCCAFSYAHSVVNSSSQQSAAESKGNTANESKYNESLAYEIKKEAEPDEREIAYGADANINQSINTQFNSFQNTGRLESNEGPIRTNANYDGSNSNYYQQGGYYNSPNGYYYENPPQRGRGN